MKVPGPSRDPGTENLPVQPPIIDPLAAWNQRRSVAIVSRGQVEHALSAIPRVDRSGLGMPYGGVQTTASPRTYERERWYLTVSPGTVRVHKRLMAPKETLWDDDGMSDAAGSVRGAITEFSRKSRANMFATLPALDYTPMFAPGNATAMVTLTLPGRHWEALVPNLGRVRKLRADFQRRYLRAWGSMPVAVWKLEFQRRGAPHLHLFMAPPSGHARGRIAKGGKPLRFKEWIGPTWAAIVDPSKGLANGDVAAFQDHAMYGTRVDYVEGTRFSDPKRIAAYFSKHGVYRDKEYQNDIPEHWRAEILENKRGGARFWGYWQLDKAEVTVELQPRGAARRAAFIDGEPVRHFHDGFPPQHDWGQNDRPTKTDIMSVRPGSGQPGSSPEASPGERIPELRSPKGLACERCQHAEVEDAGRSYQAADAGEDPPEAAEPRSEHEQHHPDDAAHPAASRRAEELENDHDYSLGVVDPTVPRGVWGRHGPKSYRNHPSADPQWWGGGGLAWFQYPEGCSGWDQWP